MKSITISGLCHFLATLDTDWDTSQSARKLDHYVLPPTIPVVLIGETNGHSVSVGIFLNFLLVSEFNIKST